MDSWLLFIVLGTFVGTVSGLFGIGGGVIMVPALLFAMKKLGVHSDYAILMATRTSLGVILFTSLYSAYNHHKKTPLNEEILKQLLIFVIMGTAIGSFFVRSIPARMLEGLLMVYVTLISLKMWFGFKLDEDKLSKTSLWGNLFVGNIIGLKSALLGIGGGTISVPYLTWKKVPITQAVGISAALGFFIALTSTVTTLINPMTSTTLPPYTYGYIYLPGVLGVLTTSLIFARLGAHYAHKLPQEKLRKAFALVLFILAVKAITKFFGIY
jgi:uncharacterized membrane protein YfcA